MVNKKSYVLPNITFCEMYKILFPCLYFIILKIYEKINKKKKLVLYRLSD